MNPFSNWTQADVDAHNRRAKQNVGEQLLPYENRRLSSRAKPEQIVRHEPVAETVREDSNAARVSIRITSYRRRLLDPDNLCPKYFVDCLRYAEIIKDDRDQDIELTVRQSKVKTRQEERTEIEITAAQLQ